PYNRCLAHSSFVFVSTFGILLFRCEVNESTEHETCIINPEGVLAQIFAQARAQFCSCTKENAFYRGHREIENPCNFLVAQLLISTSASPDSNKDLLRYVLHIRVAAQHARGRACHQSLMPLDDFLECARVTPGHQPHQSYVFRVCLRSTLVSWIFARHRSLRRLHRAEFVKKNGKWRKTGSLAHSPPRFLLQAGSALCILDCRKQCPGL